MAQRRRDETDLDEQLARLLAVQIRLQSGSQADAILALSKVGFSNGRIAELLGTTPDVAKVTVKRAAQKPATKSAARTRRNTRTGLTVDGVEA